MILKSYFRKKSTKIYISLFVAIITSILIVNSFIEYLNELRELAYIKSEIVFAMTDDDIYKVLKKNKNIVNLEELILFEKNDNNTIISEERGSTHDKITWSDLTIYELDHKKDNYIMVYSSKGKNLKLKDNEIIINFGNHFYQFFSAYSDNFIGKKVNFNFNNKELSFKVKDISNIENNNILYVSESTFNKLKNKQKKHVYTFNIKSDDALYDVVKLIEEDYKGERHEFGLEQVDIETDRKIKTFILILTITNYILIFSFALVISIISKNIILDLKNNIKLEKKMGYSSKQIKNNVFLRLFYTHIISFIISIIVYFPIIYIINNIFYIKLMGYNYLILLIIFVYTIIYDYFSTRKI